MENDRPVSWPRSEINSELPVRVAELSYNDPFLTVFGSGWSLNLACPWKGTIASPEVSWDDDDVEDLAWELIGTGLISVDDGAPGEIDFRFTDAVLHVRPDTDLDPWVLRLPGVVAVGGIMQGYGLGGGISRSRPPT